jgi:hypothetical protein
MRDLLVIVAGIYKGNACSLDTTAVIYQRAPLKRLAILSAETGEFLYAYHLSGLATSGQSASGERLFASGWVVSNCTSNWNGKRIRIDRARDSVTTGILVRDLEAKDSDEGESVRADITRDIVTFRYNGAIGDPDLLSGPAVARYRVERDRAVRIAPLALTRAGFLYEWLRISDAEVSRWSEPESLALRKPVSSALAHGYQWERVGACGGSPPVWEIAVRTHDSPELQVFRIAGSRATELRMLAITRAVTPSCTAKDIAEGLADVAAELPYSKP